jgi:hypothetical protein
VIAVYLYRMAENRRKRPEANDPDFVRYASCFIAMQMGRRLLSSMGINLNELNHRYFEEAHCLIQEKGENLFSAAVQDVQFALNSLYGEQAVSLQQLSATFRRGDLIEKLQAIAIRGIDLANFSRYLFN